MLKVSKYIFSLEASEDISLPSYKGSTFHGGIGHALMKLSPDGYNYLFAAGDGNVAWPKPFVIVPPLETNENFTKGYIFKLELILIGEAISYYPLMHSAIEYLGKEMGLGYEQRKYTINHIECSEFSYSDPLKPIQRIKLTLPTRLRLKNKNRLLKQKPDFQLILKRLIGRVRTLEKAYSNGEALSYNDDLIHRAKDIQISHSQIQWDDWDRFSGRQKEWMKFGGLTGNITFTGDLQPFMALLTLGEWLHIGSKTSFGLGKYELSLNP